MSAGKIIAILLIVVIGGLLLLGAPSPAAAGQSALVLTIYMLPTIVAFARHRRSPGSVVVVNLFLGWTIIGWIIALAMGFGGTTTHEVVHTAP